MIAVPEGILGSWFDRLTMTGHPELVEGCTPYAQIISALCIVGPLAKHWIPAFAGMTDRGGHYFS
jgi:hypothetical protein